MTISPSETQTYHDFAVSVRVRLLIRSAGLRDGSTVAAPWLRCSSVSAPASSPALHSRPGGSNRHPDICRCKGFRPSRAGWLNGSARLRRRRRRRTAAAAAPLRPSSVSDMCPDHATAFRVQESQISPVRQLLLNMNLQATKLSKGPPKGTGGLTMKQLNNIAAKSASLADRLAKLQPIVRQVLV